MDPARNVVFVGPVEDCLRRTVVVRDWNPGAAPFPEGERPLRGRAKVRRNHAPQDAEAVARGADVVVTFREPVRAPAPGQALVLYDENGWVLGGGWIAEVAA
jgi:tRNA-specific 2-thiouridylase